MTRCAVAHLRDVEMGPEIVDYLHRIDATLEYEGRFVVHGAEPEPLEGPWAGHLVVIAFPSRRQARDWYDCRSRRTLLVPETATTVAITEPAPHARWRRWSRWTRTSSTWL